jgi:hypothetical protein
MLTTFGAAPDCDMNIAGTATPFYDTDVSTCNALAVDVQVQSTSEVSVASPCCYLLSLFHVVSTDLHLA